MKIQDLQNFKEPKANIFYDSTYYAHNEDKILWDYNIITNW